MKLVRVLPEERLHVYLIWTILFLINLGFVIGWIVIHTILVKRMGIQYLPYSYIAMSVFAIGGGTVYLLFADKIKRHIIFIATVLLTLGFLLVSRLFISEHFEGQPVGLTPDLATFAILILIAQGTCGATLTMQAWTMVSDVFSPNQGKRLYPILGIASLLGGLSGGAIVPTLLTWIGVGNLLLVWTAILLLIIPIAIQFSKESPQSRNVRKQFKPSSVGVIKNLKDGLGYFRTNAVTKLLFGIAIGFSLVNPLQDFQYTQIMAHKFTTEHSLASFYGYYWFAFNASAILLQLLATEKIIRSFGVIHGFAALPLIMIFNFSFLLMHYGFLEGLWMRYSWDIIAMAIQGTAYQLSYSAMPLLFRGRVRGWIEGMVNPSAAITAGLFLVFLQFLTGHSPEALWKHSYYFTITGLVLSFLWLMWVLFSRSGYLAALIKNIKEEDLQTKIDAIESLEEKKDARCRKILLDVLQIRGYSSEQEQVLKSTAMQVLSRIGDKKSMLAMIPFLQHENSILRSEAIRTMAHFKGIASIPLLHDFLIRNMTDKFFDDPAKQVRIEAGRFLVRHETEQGILKLVENVQRTTAEQKIMTIKLLSEIRLSFHEILLQILAEDQRNEVRAEALVYLWGYPECHSQAEYGIGDMIASSDPETKKIGLMALLRIHVPKGHEWPLAVDDGNDLQLRCMIALINLSMMDQKGENRHLEIEKLFDILKNPAYRKEDRVKLVSLLPALDTHLLDEIIDTLIQLPEGERKIAAQEMDLLGEYLQKNDDE